MKLQSQATQRFNRRTLQQLAARTRPTYASRRRRNELVAWVVWGVVTGALVVVALKSCWP